MSILDKLKGLLKGKGDQIDSAIDKAADVADDKTGGQYSDKIEPAADTAKGAVDKHATQLDAARWRCDGRRRCCARPPSSRAAVTRAVPRSCAPRSVSSRR